MASDTIALKDGDSFTKITVVCDVPHEIPAGDCAFCLLDAARKDAQLLADAFLFLSRRCEEQGFYGPNRQPLVLEAHPVAERHRTKGYMGCPSSECGAGDE